VTDILDRIDAALAGHNDLVFADVMASVLDALDGARRSESWCGYRRRSH
jgi:hypothetical protein